MKTLTVFTPAYNRAHTIGRTYESLLRQTSHDFEWLIIDDGSTDGTRALVEGWIAEGRIPIRYIHQANQGMHGAHNTAYANIHTELNVCIDSDDWMPDNAVELIVDFWHRHGSDKYAGIVGLDIEANGTVIGHEFPKTLKDTTTIEFHKMGIGGDKKMVYRTDVINQYPRYPLFEGERYVGLDYIYTLIDLDWRLLVLNKPLVVVDYQADGSSAGMFRQYWNNPKGWSFYRKTQMALPLSVKNRFKVCAHYVSSSIMCKNKRFLAESPSKFMTFLSLPFGVCLYFYIKHKVARNQKFQFK